MFKYYFYISVINYMEYNIIIKKIFIVAMRLGYVKFEMLLN